MTAAAIASSSRQRRVSRTGVVGPRPASDELPRPEFSSRDCSASANRSRLASPWGGQISRAELLQNHALQFPARERVDEVMLHGSDTLGALVVGDAQLVQPFGFGLRQLAQEIVANRLDGVRLSRHARIGYGDLRSQPDIDPPTYDKSPCWKPFTRRQRTAGHTLPGVYGSGTPGLSGHSR